MATAPPRTRFQKEAPQPATCPPHDGVRRRSVLREVAISSSLSGEDLERFESLKLASRTVKLGGHLFHAGDKFNHLYSIRNGSFKTLLSGSYGHEQVTGFCMSGDLVGLDGLGAAQYNVSAVALEDSTVLLMPYLVLAALAQRTPALQRSLHSELAREVARSYGVMMLLGSMRSQERMAAFLLNLSERHVRRRSSGSSFELSMTRSDIGNYLGLSLETVSRTFTMFQRAGLMNVKKRELSAIDVERLERILEAGRLKRGVAQTS